METTEVGSLDLKILLATLTAAQSVATYQKNEIIYSQGDAANAIFVIRRGNVKLTVLSKGGKEAVIAVLGAGAFLGEGCLAGQPQRTATAEALSKSVIIRLGKATIVRMLHEQPAFLELFLRHLLLRNVRIEEDLIEHFFNSSEKRLARLLMSLANIGEENTPTPGLLKISQQTLAGMVGTTRPRISYFMNNFRRQGLIDYHRGGIEVHSDLLNIILYD
jgi:CRP/FNR family cyclic AMP-dependent transcriptional regulator